MHTYLRYFQQSLSHCMRKHCYGETSACESIRHKSMSLNELPKPFIDDPITYSPQSTKHHTNIYTIPMSTC